MKLDSYICLLHVMGLGQLTRKYPTESKAVRAFVKIPEGDGCMPWHITVCLTTCVDGKSLFWLIVELVQG